MTTVWKRMGTFLGLVEDYDDEYADLPDDGAGGRDRAAEAPPPRAEPSNVRRIPTAVRSSSTGSGATASSSLSTSVRAVPMPSEKVHLTSPTTFNDIEEVGEHFRSGVPVIMNLSGASEGVAKRLLDFASGLIFGLDGRIERVADRVFILTPTGVDVSTEERRRLSERGFFNQA